MGLLLFLCIPLVLVLYLLQPLGTLPSLGLGVALMIGHRFVARPFSAANRGRRCLWCGRPLRLGRVTLDVPLGRSGTAVFAFCPPSDDSCRRRWVGLHRVAGRYRWLLRGGIVLPVALYLVSEAARGMGWTWLRHETAAQLFRGIIAAAVVSVSFFYLIQLPAEDPSRGPAQAFPFPIHNLALLGAGWTLWIFRVVGIWWLAQLAGKAWEAVA